jgi:hypothetical protein
MGGTSVGHPKRDKLFSGDIFSGNVGRAVIT